MKLTQTTEYALYVLNVADALQGASGKEYDVLIGKILSYEQANPTHTIPESPTQSSSSL